MHMLDKILIFNARRVKAFPFELAIFVGGAGASNCHYYLALAHENTAVII